jgi:hypothetical protein
VHEVLHGPRHHVMRQLLGDRGRRRT